MDKFSEITKIDTNNVPSNFGDIPILLNKESVSYFSNYEGIRPIWIKNVYGEVYEVTNSQIQAKGVICVENRSSIYHKYEEDDIKMLLSAYIIYVESDASVCSSCHTVNPFFDVDSSRWTCSHCGNINQAWKYTETKSDVPSSATIIYDTPFKGMNYINAEFLPDYICTDKMYINKNEILEVEFYSYGEGVDNPVNPLIVSRNLKGAAYSFYPSQIGALSKITMKDGRTIFTPYTKSQLNWVLNSVYSLEYLRFERLMGEIDLSNGKKMKSIDTSLHILEMMDSSIRKLDACLFLLDSSYSVLRKKFTKLDSSYMLMDSSLFLLDSSYSVLRNKCTKLDSSYTKLDTSLYLLDTSFSLIDSSVRRIDASLLVIDSSCIRLDSSIRKLDSCMFDLDIGFRRLDTSLLALDASVRKIGASVRKIDSSIRLLDACIYNIEVGYYQQLQEPNDP